VKSSVFGEILDAEATMMMMMVERAGESFSIAFIQIYFISLTRRV
jgi:hypothetical protein